MSDSGSESGSDGQGGTGYVDLVYERLQSLHAHGTVPRKDFTKYAKKGMSAKRVKAAVTKPCCTCMCKLPVKILYQLCVAFWSLTKQSQDSCLWSIQNDSGGNSKKKQWYMAGLVLVESYFKHAQSNSTNLTLQTACTSPICRISRLSWFLGVHAWSGKASLEPLSPHVSRERW